MTILHTCYRSQPFTSLYPFFPPVARPLSVSGSLHDRRPYRSILAPLSLPSSHALAKFRPRQLDSRYTSKIRFFKEFSDGKLFIKACKESVEIGAIFSSHPPTPICPQCHCVGIMTLHRALNFPERHKSRLASCAFIHGCCNTPISVSGRMKPWWWWWRYHFRLSWWSNFRLHPSFVDGLHF